MALVCLPLLMFAQKNYPKTLLWRISGKGISQPSYLFGTMHLNDQRLFNFGDSVYSAIQRTAGLAIEVSPDELCAYFVNQLFDELENSKKLDQILNDKEYKEFSSALSKKFDKPAEDITASDIVKEKNKWMQDLMEKGEMPTFVDAYLYNLARRQGKWLGGIEDMSDQAGLMEDLVDKSDILNLLVNDSASGMDKESIADLDDMIDIYIKQDLNRIEAKFNAPSSARTKDLLLTKRNLKMARRIDSLMAIRTMFLAVGAAHLPGDSGVIQLLQKRGFTVEPVFSSKKIAAKDYKFKEVQLPWVQVKDEQELYKVEMPANPASVKLLGMMEMKFLFDIFNMSGFCTMAIVNPGHSLDRDTLMAQLTKRMFPGKQVQAPREVVNKDGVKGKEFMQKTDGSHIRLQIFPHDKVVYMVLMASVKKDAVNSPDAEKFFSSFAINKSAPVAANLRVFTDSIMGISVSTPAPLTRNKQFSVQDNESYNINAYTGTDAATGSYIMLFNRDVRPGYYILNDSLMYAEFLKNIEKQYDNLVKEERFIQGQKAVIVKGRNLKQPGIFAKAMSVIKDNRNIMLMVIGDSAHIHNGSLEPVFTSFRFIPHPALKWNVHTDESKSFTAWAPTPFRMHEDESQIFQIAFDTTTATTFFVNADTLSKYDWVSDDSTFWHRMMKDQFDGEALYDTAVKNGGLSGRETHFKDGSVHTRMRIMPSGNIVYKIFAAGAENTVKSENVNRFFNSFRLNGKAEPPTYLQSKAKLLIADLTHEDSATRYEAYAAISGAPFTKEDLPLLHKALFAKYRGVSEWYSDSTTINEELADQVALLNDASSVSYVQEQYPQLTGERKRLQGIAVYTLANMRTEESYTALTKILLTSPPNELFGYSFAYILRDSLKLAARFYPQWQQLAKDSLFGPVMANVGQTLVDSGFLSMNDHRAFEADYHQAARKWIAGLKKDKGMDSYLMYTFIENLAEMGTPASYKVIKEFLPVLPNTLRQSAVTALIKNKQSAPKWALDSVAADPNLRYNFYSELGMIKKTKHFPKKYKTQAYFAESDIYTAANEEAETESIEFLKIHKAVYKGTVYNSYLYKVVYNEDGEKHTYLGIVSGYDKAGKKIDQDKYLVTVYTDEEFDESRMVEFLETWLQAQAESEEEDEELD
jgi:uncharacterized protein YbaP (TraB family)